MSDHQAASRRPTNYTGFPQDYNFAMDSIGSGIDAAYSGISNVAVVDAKSTLVEGTGNLTPANHIGDGQHLSKAGYDILCPLIKTALATVL